MRQPFKQLTLLPIINIFFGFLVTIIACEIKQMYPEHIIFDGSLPQSIQSIFLNNLICYLVYCIPVLGMVIYTISFLYNYVVIGFAFETIGILSSLSRLIHLPAEVYALSIPISMQLFKNNYSKIKVHTIGISILLISSIVEFIL